MVGKVYPPVCTYLSSVIEVCPARQTCWKPSGSPASYFICNLSLFYVQQRHPGADDRLIGKRETSKAPLGPTIVSSEKERDDAVGDMLTMGSKVPKEVAPSCSLVPSATRPCLFRLPASGIRIASSSEALGSLLPVDINNG